MVIFLSLFLGLDSVGRTPPARVFALPKVFKKKFLYIKEDQVSVEAIHSY